MEVHTEGEGTQARHHFIITSKTRRWMIARQLSALGVDEAGATSHAIYGTQRGLIAMGEKMVFWYATTTIGTHKMVRVVPYHEDGQSRDPTPEEVLRASPPARQRTKSATASSPIADKTEAMLALPPDRWDATVSRLSEAERAEIGKAIKEKFDGLASLASYIQSRSEGEIHAEAMKQAIKQSRRLRKVLQD